MCRNLLTGIFLIALITVLSAQTPPQHTRLLDNAVMALHHQWKHIDNFAYEWTSERHLLVGSHDLTQASVQYNILTGIETPAPELVKQRQEEFAQYNVIENGITEKFHQVKFLWMNDKHYWLALQESPKTGNYIRALVGDRLTPGTLQEIPLPADSPFNQINHSIGCTVSPERILALPGRFYQYHHPKQSTPVLYEISIHGKTVSAKKHFIVLPKGAGLREVEISTNGKLIAWRLREIYRPPYSMLQSVHLSDSWKKIAWTKSKARAINSIWISNGEGTQMREIGYIDVPLRESDMNPAVSEGIWLTGSDEPKGLKWLPGNKYMSLWVQDEMYRFPVSPGLSRLIKQPDGKRISFVQK